MAKVKVKISGVQELFYSQEVEIEEDEFRRLSKMLDEDENLASELIFDLCIDLLDPVQATNTEVDTFKIITK